MAYVRQHYNLAVKGKLGQKASGKTATPTGSKLKESGTTRKGGGSGSGKGKSGY